MQPCTALLTAAALAGGFPSLETARSRRRERNLKRWRPDDPRHPLRVVCPTCGAAAGEPCTGRLGRHLNHWSRVDAAAKGAE